MAHNFGEKAAEFSPRQGEEVPVWKSPKFEISKKKAIEVIESGKYGVEDGDFWILKNETKGGKMAYTGLITSHNACLKINDVLDSKFKPSCVTVDKTGYQGSLVYTYCCDEQGIYEVGEASPSNCKNAYPYAMAYKRLFDRVVLKLSKLAYAGVYSEAEADEFKQPIEAPDEEAKQTAPQQKQATPKQIASKQEPPQQTATPEQSQNGNAIGEKSAKVLEAMLAKKDISVESLLAAKGAKSLAEISTKQYGDIIRGISLETMLVARNVNIPALLTKKGVKSLAELSEEQYASITKQLENVEDKAS